MIESDWMSQLEQLFELTPAQTLILAKMRQAAFTAMQTPLTPLVGIYDQAATVRLAEWIWEQMLATRQNLVCFSWERLRQEIMPEERQDPVVDATLRQMGIAGPAIDWHRIFRLRIWTQEEGAEWGRRVCLNGVDRRGIYIGYGANTGSANILEMALRAFMTPNWEQELAACLPRRAQPGRRKNGKVESKFIGPRRKATWPERLSTDV